MSEDSIKLNSVLFRLLIALVTAWSAGVQAGECGSAEAKEGTRVVPICNTL